MKKRFKVIGFFIVIIFYITLISLSLFNVNFTNELINKITYILPLAGSLFMFIYDQWTLFFILVRKSIASIFGDTVSWRSSYKYYVGKDFDFAKFLADFKNVLEKNNIEVFNYSKSMNDQGKYVHVNIEAKKNGLQSKAKIECTEEQHDKSIMLTFSSSAAYKDSKKELSLFFCFVFLLQQKTPSSIDKGAIEKLNIKNSVYSSTISMNRYNPMYKYVLKHVDGDDSSDFCITTSEKNAKVKIKRKEMRIIAYDEESFKKILNSYIPISSIE